MCKLFALFHILISILNFFLPFILFGLNVGFFLFLFLVWFVYLFSSYLLSKKPLYNTHYVEFAYNIISMTNVQHKLVMKGFFSIYKIYNLLSKSMGIKLSSYSRLFHCPNQWDNISNTKHEKHLLYLFFNC